MQHIINVQCGGIRRDLRKKGMFQGQQEKQVKSHVGQQFQGQHHMEGHGQSQSEIQHDQWSQGQ